MFDELVDGLRDVHGGADHDAMGRDARIPGSENLAGVESRAIDALIREVLEAETRAELEVSARALDRVLIHGQFILPFRYLAKHHLM